MLLCIGEIVLKNIYIPLQKQKKKFTKGQATIAGIIIVGGTGMQLAEHLSRLSH